MPSLRGLPANGAALAALSVLALVMAQAAHGQTLKVLYSFAGAADGATPTAGLIRDSAGNFYGTTYEGGAYGFGTVFKLDTTDNHTVLYSFKGGQTGPDGAYPYAGLTRDSAGNLYGTTAFGGYGNCYEYLYNGPKLVGCGTVFKLNTSNQETVLYRFHGGDSGPDGGFAYSGVTLDSSGNLYGTTATGGAISGGCVVPNYATRTLVYIGCGTIYKLNSAGQETVLYRFAWANGAFPWADLIHDSSGNLFGTTPEGGAYGKGTVFKLATSGTENALHSFSGPDGQGPLRTRLIQDGYGNFYGTTEDGGTHGFGTIFKLDATGHETVLHSFSSAPDGNYPIAGLIRDTAGNLYGMTSQGGAYGLGTIFKLDTTGKETVQHSFSGPDGSGGVSNLLLDASGTLYGTTPNGGAHGYGTVFKLSP